MFLELIKTFIATQGQLPKYLACKQLLVVSVICFLQINRFQQYIQAEAELLEAQQSLVGESMKLTLMMYTQFGNEVALLKRLFIYQRDKNIIIEGLLEDCEHAIKLQSYQQCQNGLTMNNPDVEIIQTIYRILKFNIATQIRSLKILRIFKYVFGQCKQRPIYDKSLEKIYFLFVNEKLQVALSQVQNGNEQQVYLFVTIPQLIQMDLLTYKINNLMNHFFIYHKIFQPHQLYSLKHQLLISYCKLTSRLIKDPEMTRQSIQLTYVIDLQNFLYPDFITTYLRFNRKQYIFFLIYLLYYQLRNNDVLESFIISLWEGKIQKISLSEYL
ncbi:hypothetical protein pb186bvf_016262 [Paramecium bursaria]